MLSGRIIKGVAGLYHVYVAGEGCFACPARGLFRKNGQTPIPGDLVTIDNIDYNKMTGYLKEILPRKNELIRPRAANIDQALIVFSIKTPDLNLLLLDTMLAYSQSKGVMPVICLNKSDLSDSSEINDIVKIYNRSGYPVTVTSTTKGTGVENIKKHLDKKTTILTGPSGVGKSSLINTLFPELSQETGALSLKTSRGKNTTRQCQLFKIGENTFIADSPGFTSFETIDFPKEDLQYCFPEFTPFIGSCFYADCLHLSEHDCAIKQHVGEEIPLKRYQNYIALISKN